ncbi:hypothetical protein BpHYR1_032706 [Brachionus plicatilis]|uniref:Uncharacterized protein n=1 Tax=Brachionus plicatilis TaxID=10195 RepID=A0A3M7Q3Y9_BRAPC|nr:hypothetical protein BpHYR1_032706 [Brachionus plicatilis]
MFHYIDNGYKISIIEVLNISIKNSERCLEKRFVFIIFGINFLMIRSILIHSELSKFLILDQQKSNGSDVKSPLLLLANLKKFKLLLDDCISFVSIDTDLDCLIIYVSEIFLLII